MQLGANERPRILVVDDEPSIREMLVDLLSLEGYHVETAPDGEAAVGVLGRSRIDLVLSDLMMPRMGGLALLDEVGKAAPRAVTVLMTGYGTVESAIDAMKRGAYDFVLKPFKLDHVVRVIERGLEKQRIAAENLRLRETVSLYKVSEAIAASLSLEEVVATVSRGCTADVGADAVSIWLDDGEGSLFERSSERSQSVPVDARLGTLDAPKLAARLEREGWVLEHGGSSLDWFADRPELPTASFLAMPLRSKRGLVGVVALTRFEPLTLLATDGSPTSTVGSVRFDEGERKLVSLLVSRASAAIENARLYQDLKSTFQQTIEGLAKAIDRMDRYTAGHSERVAEYAVFLGKELGLGAAEREILRHAALMHDIGKIGCVLNLNKPGKLTEPEYEAFKRHPGYGRDILEPIRFLQPLIPGVLLHHERWDGKGYPHGLAGPDIPLIARVISVADTYDAMTTDRSYRRALPHEVSMAEIERCAGSQFDPDVAGTFTERIEAHRDAERDVGRFVPD